MEEESSNETPPVETHAPNAADGARRRIGRGARRTKNSEDDKMPQELHNMLGAVLYGAMYTHELQKQQERQLKDSAKPQTAGSPATAAAPGGDDTRTGEEGGRPSALQKPQPPPFLHPGAPAFVPSKEVHTMTTDADPSTTESPAPERNQVQAALDAIDKQIPSDSEALRKTQLFQSTRKLLQFQRDQYLVGREYAQWAQRERQKQQKREKQQQQQQRFSTSAFSNLTFARIPQLWDWTDLPHDPTALGHGQIASLTARFLPSPTVHNAALPLVARLPGTALYQPTHNAAMDFLANQETRLENLLQERLLIFLKNPNNRTMVKNSTHGFLVHNQG